MLQLGFLYYAINRHNVKDEQEKYFRWMIIITLFSFLADIISNLYNVPDRFFPFSAAGNYIEIILNTLLLPIFYRYICDQVINIDTTLTKRLNLVLWIMSAVCAFIVISTAFTGKIFYFDDNNIYHRGPLFPLPMFLLFVMMAIIEVFLVSQKQKIEAHYYLSLLLFLLFPLVGWALQCLVFGLPFSLLGITFAALVLYTNIQNRNMDKDYLTGAFNRQALDHYMQHKIDTATEQKTFSAILIDLDEFKSINDRFGHFEGDDALINLVQILRNSVKNADFIARYGGDEFCVILNSDDSEVVEDTIHQISKSLACFNENGNKPYQLSFSMGYGIYELAIGNKADLFLRIIDKKMYEQKEYTKHLQQDSQ
jgi:diguanylate cyclase (GGDEF)-like protein